MYQLKESNAPKFEFEFEGERYAIPSRQGLPLSTFRAMRKTINDAENPEEATFDEVMKVFDKYAPKVMKKIDLEQAMELFKAYALDDDGASLGES